MDGGVGSVLRTDWVRRFGVDAVWSMDTLRINTYQHIDLICVMQAQLQALKWESNDTCSNFVCI